MHEELSISLEKRNGSLWNSWPSFFSVFAHRLGWVRFFAAVISIKSLCWSSWSWVPVRLASAFKLGPLPWPTPAKLRRRNSVIIGFRIIFGRISVELPSILLAFWVHQVTTAGGRSWGSGTIAMIISKRATPEHVFAFHWRSTWTLPHVWAFSWTWITFWIKSWRPHGRSI